ncbi:retrovirus-related pol polyprotein from transposon TNT 1-94 [Tanacetum coccineum]
MQSLCKALSRVDLVAMLNPKKMQKNVQAVPNEDANQKFLRALPSSWNNIALIMRNKDGIDDLDIDDLYNNLKVFEADIKGSSGSSSNSQNVAFLSAEDTSSSNEINTANGVSTASGHNSQGQASSSSYTNDLMEFSVARTPQQNGVAERKNRTLIEATRTMLVDSLLPTVFWAKAVNTACYVLNRVLVTKPHNKTPYELIIGRPPNISFMRPFGCPVTILNTLDPLGKFDRKAKEGFLVGYSNEQALKNVLDKMMDQEKEASEQSDAKVKILGIFCQCLFDDEDLDTYNSPFADQVMELTKIAQALDDESGVEAMQEELLYSENQKVWKLVNLPMARKPIYKVGSNEFNGRAHFLLAVYSQAERAGSALVRIKSCLPFIKQRYRDADIISLETQGEEIDRNGQDTPRDNNVADLLTKAFDVSRFNFLVASICAYLGEREGFSNYGDLRTNEMIKAD